MADKLTLEQMRQRRIRGARMLARGDRPAAVARTLGVTRQSVMRWARALELKGMDFLGQVRQRGGRSQLSQAQLLELTKLLEQGALAAGFASDRWTLRRAKAIILKHFALTLSTSAVWRALRRIGWNSRRRGLHAKQQSPHSAESDGHGARG